MKVVTFKLLKMAWLPTMVLSYTLRSNIKTMYSYRQILDGVIANIENVPATFPYGETINSDFIARIKNAPHLQDLLAEFRAEAQQAVATPIPELAFSFIKEFDLNGNRRTHEQPFFDRRRRLLVLALVLFLDGDNPHYLEALENLIWQICNEAFWTLPASMVKDGLALKNENTPDDQTVDLFTAETSHALAETLFLLGSKLHPRISKRVEAEIERRVFKPMFNDPSRYAWESNRNNWAAVCGGSIGMTALLLIKDSSRLAGMLERVFSNLEVFLESYGEDGGCSEGVIYWVYGFGYYLYFAEMIYEFTSGELDLLQTEKIKKIAAFPLGVYLSGNIFVNFSDSKEYIKLPRGMVSRLAMRLGQAIPPIEHFAGIKDDWCYRWGHATRNLFWATKSNLDKVVPTKYSYYPDLAWIISRKTQADKPVCFAAKGGHNAEPHNQNDLGNFILHLNGENLLADLGAGLYSREYFSANRYDSLFTSSLGHSVPVINGQTQQPGREFSATVLRSEETDNICFFELDLTHGYQLVLTNLSRFERRFKFLKQPEQNFVRLELTDTFEFTSPENTLEERFISLHQPWLDNQAGKVIWRGKAGEVQLNFDATRFKGTIEVIETVEHQGSPITVYLLKLACLKVTYRFVASFNFDCFVGD